MANLNPDTHAVPSAEYFEKKKKGEYDKIDNSFGFRSIRSSIEASKIEDPNGNGPMGCDTRSGVAAVDRMAEKS